MTAADVLKVLEALDSLAPGIWVDGGWGVDALVEAQTRDHNDLDLAVDRNDLPHIEQDLAAIGFRHDLTATPGLPARFVLVDADRRQIDVHPLHFDRLGNGWQQLSETGRAWACYPAQHLRATGSISGRRVRCLSPKLQLWFRMGYEWSDRDEHDAKLLATRFGVGPLPPLP